MRPQLPGKLGVALERLVRSFYDQLGYETARLADPELVGPLAAPRLRLLVALTASLAVSSAVTAAIAVFYSPLLGATLLLASLALTGLYHAIPHLWRSMLASGIEGELPGVLVYLVPYSANPRYLADVLAGVDEGFRWFRHESARLRLLLDMGLDPITALRRLAETTPSRRLREVLEEYISLQLIGATSSVAAARIMDRAIESVRAKWKGYAELGRAALEIFAAGLVGIVAIAPMLGEAAGLSTLLVVPMVLALALLVLASRPSLGDAPRSMLAPAMLLAVAGGASLLVAWGHHHVAVALLAVASVVLEALAYRHRRREARALRALRVAVEKARLGLDYQADLEEATPLGGPVRAVARASRIAGSIGVGRALDRLLRVVEEAVHMRGRVALEALVLEAITVAVPALLIVALARLQQLLAGGQTLLPVGGVDLSIILALSPLAPLPAEALRRGYRPSGVPILLALLGALAVLP